jgi:integrase
MASGAARCGAPGDAFAAPAPDPGGPGVISCNCRSAQRQEMVFVNLFDVRIHAIRHRRNRRRPLEVRWHAADRSRSKSFITRRLADSYRAELVRAARKGLEFDPVTGEPVLWAAPQPAATTWYRHALAYTDMKWPELAAHSRASMAEALATITPALTTATGQRPPAQVLRTALYGHAFNPQRQTRKPDPATAAALAWLERASLPVARLQNPQVTRQALDALAVRLDRRRAAANTITRKRAVFHNALGYAVELGLLEVNPLGQFQRRTPRAANTADPRVIASPGQVDAILKQVSRIRPELTAFFGCLYYAALRPEEAVALRRDGPTLPASGWGQLTLTAALPRSARAWTGNGTAHEPRGLKLRPEGATRTVPIPPQLVSLLCWHLPAHGTAPDGRLFRGARGGPLSESLYGRIWHQACAAASSAQHAIHPVLRPYDLRHAALSLWLASGAPPAEIAARAGHSVNVLLAVYAHCIPGHDQIANRHIEQALGAGSRPAAGPPKCRDTGRIPSVMRPCHSWTQWDTAGPSTPGQDRKPACDLREHPPRRSALRTRRLDARLPAHSAAGR